MTDNEIFDTVVKGILKQGKPSILKGYCKYRGPDNTKCAAGLLISDDDYSSEFEEKAAWCNPEYGSYKDSELIVQRFFESKGLNARFINRLQIIHDDVAMNSNQNYFIEDWKSEMRKLGNELGFNTDLLC